MNFMIGYLLEINRQNGYSVYFLILYFNIITFGRFFNHLIDNYKKKLIFVFFYKLNFFQVFLYLVFVMNTFPTMQRCFYIFHGIMRRKFISVIA